MQLPDIFSQPQFAQLVFPLDTVMLEFILKANPDYNDCINYLAFTIIIE